MLEPVDLSQPIEPRLAAHAELEAEVVAAIARGLALRRFPPEATNAVRCTGQPLSPVIWTGRQWAVTEYGLEARDGRYAVEIGQLRQMEGDDRAHWAKHLAGKPWVDVPDAVCAIVALNLIFDLAGKPTGDEPE